MVESIVNQIGFCGIYCGNCDMGNGSIVNTAKNLEKFAKDYEFEKWYQMIPVGESEKFDFQEFKKGMKWFMKYSLCPGCQMGGGPPECKVKICAKEKGFEICSECDLMNSCKKINWVEENYSKVRKTLNEIKKKGKEKWIEKHKIEKSN